MRVKIDFDADGYINHMISDSTGEYELDDDFEFVYMNCYHLVEDKLVLDELRKKVQVEYDMKKDELNILKANLEASDYILMNIFDDIIALENPLTFISDIIKIFKSFKNEFKEVLSKRAEWKERIKELSE